MISRLTTSIPKEDVAFLRLLYSDLTCSQAYRQRFQVYMLPGVLSVLPGSPKIDIGPLRLDTRASRYSQACHQRSQVFPWLSPDLPHPSWFFPGAPGFTWGPPHQSSIFWSLSTMQFWSDHSHTLPEAPCGKISYCGWSLHWGLNSSRHLPQACAMVLAAAWCDISKCQSL